MHPARWLEAAFGSESRVRILRVLLANPSRTYSEREIAAAVGMSHNTVNLAVKRLESSELVRVESVGNAHAVKLRADGPLREALRRVFEAEERVWESAVEAIRAAVPADAVCYLYGSSARGSSHGESDVDVLVVAKDKETAAEVAFAIERKVHGSVPARLQIVALGAKDALARSKRAGIVREATEHGRRLSRRSLKELVEA